MTDVTIVNSALHRIGAERITALSDQNKRAILMNDIYDIVRKEVLEAGKWTFARERLIYTTRKATFTDAEVIVASDEIDWGTTKHYYRTGDIVTFSLTSGTVPAGLTDGTTYYVIRVDAYEIQLATTWANAIAGTNVTITTTGSGSFGLTAEVPDFQYNYKYALPTDYLGFLDEYDDLVVEVEGRYFLSDESTLKIRYIKDVTDTSLFTPNFTKAFYLTLAANAEYSINNNISGKESLLAEAQNYIDEARCFDAQGTKPDNYEIREFTDSRF